MDPFTVSTAFMRGAGTQATASQLGGFVNGIAYGPSGPQPFFLSDNGFLGRTFSMAGNRIGLRPDFIPQVPLGGQSFSVFAGLRPLGFIGQNPLSPGFLFGGNLSPQFATALASALRSLNLL